MSAKTIYTCDHCGKPVNYAVYDMPDLYACSKEHLGLALAKAFGLPMDNNTLRLVTEKNDALNAARAAIIERDKAQADIAELGNTIQQWATKCQDLDRQLTNALLASRSANQCTDAERQQFEITIEQQKARIAKLETQLATLNDWAAICGGKTPGQVFGKAFRDGFGKRVVKDPDKELVRINGELRRDYKREQELDWANAMEIGAQAVLRAFGPVLAKQAAVVALGKVRERIRGNLEGDTAEYAVGIVDDELTTLETPKPTEPPNITIPTKPTKPLAVACDNCGGTGLALVAGDNTAECAKCRGKGYL